MIDKSIIITESLEVHDEDSWRAFNKRHFSSLSDDTSDEPEEFERQDRRQPVNVNGLTWHPVIISAKDKDMKFLNWKLCEQIFRRLHPVDAAHNDRYPERYEKICVYCEMSTAARQLITCPICEHELLILPVRQDDN